MTRRDRHTYFVFVHLLMLYGSRFSQGFGGFAFRHLGMLALLISPCVLTYSQNPIFESRGFADEIDAQINSIYQDHDGLIWLGTSKGLYRYSGVDYELINPPNTEASIGVTALSGIEGELVVAYGANVFRYDASSELHNWRTVEYPGVQKITGIVVDAEGAIIISTYGEGLFIRSGSTWKQFSLKEGLLGADIYAIEIDVKDDLWIATDNGVSILASGGNRNSISHVTRSDGLNDEIVYSLARDSNGMWLGFHSGGFCHVGLGSEREIKFVSENWENGPVISLVLDGSRGIWIATEDEGIFRIHLHSDNVILDEPERMNQFGFEGASDLMIDRNSRLWGATNASDLFSADLKMERLNSDVGEVQAICESREGAIYVGTNNGLFSMVNERFVKISAISGNILSLHEDKYKNIWVGSFGDGVYVWSPATGKLKSISEKNGLRNGSVFSIDSDSAFIWIATLDGIVEFDHLHDASTTGELEFGHLDVSSTGMANVFQKVFVGSDGSKWFGTSGQGVLVKRGQQLVNIMHDTSQYLKTVYCFAEDSEGTVWMATDKFGLYLYRHGRVLEFPLNENLRSKSIMSLHEHGDNMFFIHDQGIDVFDLNTGAMTYVGSSQEMENFTPALNAVSAGETNGMWIGAYDKIFKYPDLTKLSHIQPTVLLDEVYAWDKRIDKMSTPKLSSNENYLSIRYTGLWYDDPRMVSFQYKLEGQDLDWIRTGDRSLTYANLSPGKYELFIRPVVYGQIIYDHNIQFPFEISRPFYLRAWFLIPSILALVGLFLKFLQYKQEMSEKKMKNERDRIELKYEILKAQINPHFLFNSFNTLASFVEEDPKLAVEYIEKLSDYYRTITQYRDHKLITVEKELQIMMDYIFLLKKRFGENLHYKVSVVDRTKRIPPLTLQLLVENAVKHNVVSALKPLHIHIESEGTNSLIVRNTLQLKRTSGTSTKFGLNTVMNRIQLATGREIEITQSASEFIVHIPLAKSQDQ